MNCFSVEKSDFEWTGSWTGSNRMPRLLVMFDFSGRDILECIISNFRSRAAYHEIAFHLGRIKHMQWAPTVVSDVVSDIHQSIDWPQADGREPTLQPLWACAVPDAAHKAQSEAAA